MLIYEFPNFLIHTDRLNGPEPEGLGGVRASNHEEFLLYRQTFSSCGDILHFFVKICRKFNFDKLFNGVHKYLPFLAIFGTCSSYGIAAMNFQRQQKKSHKFNNVRSQLL